MQPLVVSRVLGDGPFAEIGDPQALEFDEERGLIAVGGHVGWLQRIGTGVGGATWKPHAIGIYDRADLRCRFLVRSRYPVRSMAFHPRSPLLAIGTGSYDGGMFFHGELLLLNLDSGEVVSALESGPEVRVVTWRSWSDGKVLDLAVSPCDDEELRQESYTVGFDAMVVREDWTSVRDGEIGHRELDGPMRESGASASAEEARAHVVGLCPEWSLRREVWAVENLRDGRVLAALDGARIESWLPSGEREWSVVDGSVGRQLDLAADQESAWSVARVGWDASVGLHSLRDGKPLEVPDPSFADLLTTRPERRLAVRHASTPYFLHSPDHDAEHFVGEARDVRVVTADGPLFLFAWNEDLRRQPWSGPGVEVAGALVHVVVSIDGPLAATLVRRRLPDGLLEWHTALDHLATAVEVDAGGAVVYAALESGALLALDAVTGEVLWEQGLVVNGLPTVGLSLASAEPGRLVIGTVDGRVLELHHP